MQEKQRNQDLKLKQQELQNQCQRWFVIPCFNPVNNNDEKKRYEKMNLLRLNDSRVFLIIYILAQSGLFLLFVIHIACLCINLSRPTEKVECVQKDF